MIVIIEPAEQAVYADQLQGREITAFLAFQAEFLGAHIGFGQAHAGVILHGHRDKIGTLLFGLSREVFGQNLYRGFGRKPNLGSEKNFQFILPALQLQNALDYLRFSELGASDFNG